MGGGGCPWQGPDVKGQEIGIPNRGSSAVGKVASSVVVTGCLCETFSLVTGVGIVSQLSIDLQLLELLNHDNSFTTFSHGSI